jgi:hypothetical protein
MIILTKQFTHPAPVVQDESNATMKHIRTCNNNKKAARWPFFCLVALMALASSSLAPTAQAYDSLFDDYDLDDFDADFFDVEAFFDYDYYGDDGDDEEEENGLGDPTLSPTMDIITTPSPTAIADSLTPSPTLIAAFAAGTPPPTTATAPREGGNGSETIDPTLSPTADIITTPSPTEIAASLTLSPTLTAAAASFTPPPTTKAGTAPPTTTTSANRTTSMIPTAAPTIINLTSNSSENGPLPTGFTPGILSDAPSDSPSDAPSDVPSDAPSSIFF